MEAKEKMGIYRALRGFLRLIFLVFLIFPSIVFAGSVLYSYDNDGRLIKTVTDTGETLIYNYDSAGRLVSITNQTVNANLPSIDSISPSVLFRGTTTSVTITGSNLLTVQSVTSDNSGVTISGVQSTATQVTATMQVSAGASLGQTNITVKTFYGSVSIGLQILQTSLSPSPLYMQVGETKQISVGVTPSPQGNINISINNPSPDVLGTPQYITIDTTGSATLTVNGLTAGSTVLDIGGVKSAAFVSNPFIGPVSITANSVSVLLGPVTSGGFTSKPVSVQMVSVPNGMVSSRQVCVKISNQ